jgi:hypothetical protein
MPTNPATSTQSATFGSGRMTPGWARAGGLQSSGVAGGQDGQPPFMLQPYGS